MQLYDILAALFDVLDDTVKLWTSKRTLKLWMSGEVTVRMTGYDLSAFTPSSAPPTSNFLAVSPGFDREERGILKGIFKILLGLGKISICIRVADSCPH